MHSPIAHSLDALALWRATLGRHIGNLSRALAEDELLDEAEVDMLAALRERMASDKLVVAFVAEVSRGKSELINAIFFAQAGRRVLPAAPGRTTMCPVELRWDRGMTPRLSLLPIETRLGGMSLLELRGRDGPWQHVPLDPRRPDSLVQALAAVTRTQQVSVEQARALGLWNDDDPQDNPPRDAAGDVEVPAWRHALIQYPHPLLERGLVVIDTPGLNAIGAEPELTLGLLPTAHAIVFLLAADCGATRSDLSIWREHLSTASVQRFVVLNKIDILADPLATDAEVRAQVEQQRAQSAQTLDVPLSRVFALSARDALTARFCQDATGLAASQLPVLEQALAAELLPRRQQLLQQSATTVLQAVRGAAVRQLADRRRQRGEQLFELRGLRGKSGGRLRALIERLDAEVLEFERCAMRLAALRSVQQRLQKLVLAHLSSDTLRAEMQTMQAAMGARPLNLGSRVAFDAMLARLQAALAAAQTQIEEMRLMLQASFEQLNTEFGFAFLLAPVPPMADAQAELHRINKNYSRYLALGKWWRMATPGFADQFRRMLLSKLRVVFENAAGDVEMWSKGATSQLEQQLRERRRGHAQRQEALQRVQSAAGDLEQRISEVQGQDERLARAQGRIERLADDALAAAAILPVPPANSLHDPHRMLEPQDAA